jgi:hypothetical protein
MAFKMKNPSLYKMAKMAGDNRSAYKHVVKKGPGLGTDAGSHEGAALHNAAHARGDYDMNHQKPKAKKEASPMKKDGKPGRWERMMNNLSYKIQDLGDAYSKSKLGKFMGNLDYKMDMLMDPPTEAEKKESARIQAITDKMHKEYLAKKQKEKDQGGPSGTQPLGPGIMPSK